MNTPFPLALDGIRVIDLSRVIAGPWCGALLGDLGADVIKVEDTGSGDESRTWPPYRDGEGAAYLLFNRNKRGMTLDLKAPEGTEIVKALVKNADVVVLDERFHDLRALRRLEIERHAALVPVEEQVRRALAVTIRGPGAGLVAAAGILHLDDVSAQIAE